MASVRSADCASAAAACACWRREKPALLGLVGAVAAFEEGGRRVGSWMEEGGCGEGPVPAVLVVLAEGVVGSWGLEVGVGRFGSRRERWRFRGMRGVGVLVVVGRRDVFEAFREGGPTKREGARRLDVVFVRGKLLLFGCEDAIMEGWLFRARERRGIGDEVELHGEAWRNPGSSYSFYVCEALNRIYFT
ncbi:hypothetical protein BU16DRAFT_139494 [Lophium mytilinum]|uniref:Uncharacterized protein n=1 Tax=Lophium mytilinum TaxID=390894 RepID=A0A6A6QFS1_9PEZI|nr:hypothetical protein BU16DRAFT_139494 [Lophium mytilinum]